MTVIVYRDGIMAADTGARDGEFFHSWANKLARHEDGSIHGAAGMMALCEGYLRWVRGEADSYPHSTGRQDGNEHYSDYVVLIARRLSAVDVQVEFYESKGKIHYLNPPYYATGSGASVAMGALWAGATAIDAVKAAIAHGYANGDVISLALGDWNEKSS